MTSPRYTFDEVKHALHGHWGLGLHRGGEMGDGDDRHDGRWTVEYSRTGFVVGGAMPRSGHGFRRYETLGHVVASWELAAVIKQERAKDRAEHLKASKIRVSSLKLAAVVKEGI